MTKKSKGSAHAETISAPAGGNSTYDFKGESPSHEVGNSLKKKPRKTTGEKQKLRTDKNPKSVGKPNKVKTETRKEKQTSLNIVTPKTNKPSSRNRYNEVVTSTLPKLRCKQILKPIPPPNLDDISPIVTDTKQLKKRSKNEKLVPEKDD